MNHACITLLMTAALTGGEIEAGGKPDTSDKLVVKTALVTLIEQVEVPAREAGQLADMLVREGALVKTGDRLAQIDDKHIRLELERAQIDVRNASKEAQNDVKVRFAQKSLELATAELKRANDSLARYPKSISASEIDRLKLARQKAELEIEQAQHDMETAQNKLEVSQNDLKLAENNVERRQVLAPISGVVAEINRRRGEWVKPGDPVLRILKIHTLRAEGFMKAEKITGDLNGAKTTLSVVVPGKTEPVELPGKLVFVSHEINPVNGQVRVWAEIENEKLLLRPGMRGSLTIHPPQAAAETKTP